jgi:hypothetical protein
MGAAFRGICSWRAAEGVQAQFPLFHHLLDLAVVFRNGVLYRRQRLHGQYHNLNRHFARLKLTPALQISEWILLIAAYAFVGLRLYTRVVVQREKLRVSEWVLIVAAIDALGLIICEYGSIHPIALNLKD